VLTSPQRGKNELKTGQHRTKRLDSSRCSIEPAAYIHLGTVTSKWKAGSTRKPSLQGVQETNTIRDWVRLPGQKLGLPSKVETQKQAEHSLYSRKTVTRTPSIRKVTRNQFKNSWTFEREFKLDRAGRGGRSPKARALMLSKDSDQRITLTLSAGEDRNQQHK